MLEPSEVVEFITDHLRPHYRELDACWQAIQKAKTQIAKLEPIADCHRRIEEAKARKLELETLQQAASPYYNHRHLTLRHQQAAVFDQQLTELNAQKTDLQTAQNADNQERDAKLRELAAEQVEQSIQRVKVEMRFVQAAKDEKQRKYDALKKDLDVLGRHRIPESAEEFEELRASLRAERGLVQGNLQSTEEKRLGLKMEQSQALQRRETAAAELETLRQSQALIPREFVSIRQALCAATGIAAEELPFAGELLEVKAEFREWTGAIERLLHAFGVSLVVPEQHYMAATRFINERRLVYRDRGLRLNYNKVWLMYPQSAEVD
jgi:uncharacterized protein YPO0396